MVERMLRLIRISGALGNTVGSTEMEVKLDPRQMYLTLSRARNSNNRKGYGEGLQW